MIRREWHEDRREVWRLYQTVSRQLMDLLDHELHQHHDLALIDYEILFELLRSDDRRLRMSDLASQVLVSRSRLTYRIDRLVDTSLVVREGCEDDRRGMWAVITEDGERVFKEAQTSHEAAIDAWFFDQMEGDEFDSIRQSLSRMAVKLSRGPSRPA